VDLLDIFHHCFKPFALFILLVHAIRIVTVYDSYCTQTWLRAIGQSAAKAAANAKTKRS
jgi:hypothetical protein